MLNCITILSILPSTYRDGKSVARVSEMMKAHPRLEKKFKYFLCLILFFFNNKL